MRRILAVNGPALCILSIPVSIAGHGPLASFMFVAGLAGFIIARIMKEAE